MSEKRPKVLPGVTERIETPRGRVYVTVNFDSQKRPYEVFVDSYDPEAKALCRMIALCLQSGVEIDEILEQLWRVETRDAVWDVSERGRVLIRSLSQAIALAIGRVYHGKEYKGYYQNGVVPEKKSFEGAICPECGGIMYTGEGCSVCYNCGYSKCS